MTRKGGSGRPFSLRATHLSIKEAGEAERDVNEVFFTGA
jgi:hypothetical protein